MKNENIFSCVLCDTPISDEQFANNTGMCVACKKQYDEETKDMVQEYVDDEIIISDIPLFNQEEFNKLFEKYPEGIIESDRIEEYCYSCYENGLLTSNYDNEAYTFAYDIWNPNAMIPVVSVRKTCEGADKIYVELYMTQEEYRVEYLGEQDLQDEVLYEVELK